MKISASRDSFLSALQLVHRAVSTRAATQALAGILVAPSEGGAVFRATDMTLALQTRLEGEIAGTEPLLLPGRLLLDVVRSLPDTSVSIETREAERDAEITAGSSRFHLRTLPADDFPRFPEAAEETVSLPASTLVSTVEVVARAASRDDMRPVLTGILMTLSGAELTMVATDSYRLSVKRAEVEGDGTADLEANVPARALVEVARIAQAQEAESVGISLLPNQAIFEIGGVTLATRLIEGQFPNYRQLLPESYEHEVRLPRGELLEVVRRVSQLAQRNAPLRLAFAPGELTVSAETPEIGDARESMPASFEGEPLEIGFNPEFLRDGIDSVAGEELLLRLISPLRPGLLQPVEGEDFSYLVMPIRLNV